MKAIYKDWSGNLTVEFNKAYLSSEEYDVFIKGIMCFYDFINFGQSMSFTDLISVVQCNDYIDHEKCILLNCLEKASIQQEIACNVYYSLSELHGVEKLHMSVWCENSEHFSVLIPHDIRGYVVKVELLGAKSIYRKGILTYDLCSDQKHIA